MDYAQLLKDYSSTTKPPLAYLMSLEDDVLDQLERDASEYLSSEQYEFFLGIVIDFVMLDLDFEGVTKNSHGNFSASIPIIIGCVKAFKSVYKESPWITNNLEVIQSRDMLP